MNNCVIGKISMFFPDKVEGSADETKCNKVSIYEHGQHLKFKMSTLCLPNMIRSIKCNLSLGNIIPNIKKSQIF